MPRAAKRLGIAAPDSYEAQATDWISIVALTIAKAGETTGTAIRDNVRKITNSDGMTVYTAVDGLAAVKAGKDVNSSVPAVRAPSRISVTFPTASFAITTSRTGRSSLSRWVSGYVLTDTVQLILNGIMAGAILTTPAIGFTAIYAVLRFPNFAVASHATVGAFAGYCANVWLGMPLLPAAAVAFLVAGIGGVVSDTLVLRPLRPAGLVTTTIASSR